MDKEKANSPIRKFVNSHYSKIAIIEKISLAVFALGQILFWLKHSNLDFILITGSILLAVTYFLLSFRTIEIDTIKNTSSIGSIGIASFVYKISYWGLAVISITFIFLALDLTAVNRLIIIGGITTVLALFFSLKVQRDLKSKMFGALYYMRMTAFIFLLIVNAMVRFELIK
jgi:hypothetical protein